MTVKSIGTSVEYRVWGNGSWETLRKWVCRTSMISPPRVEGANGA